MIRINDKLENTMADHQKIAINERRLHDLDSGSHFVNDIDVFRSSRLPRMGSLLLCEAGRRILSREFAIGFGPKVFSYKRGETRYTIRLFPLGGFVRMAGEDPELVKFKMGKPSRSHWKTTG